MRVLLGRRANWTHWIVLGALVLLAAGLRLYRLASLPPGMWHDEAYNGLDALTLLRGAPRPLFHEEWEKVAWAEQMPGLLHWRWPIFFYGTYGREPLYCYLLAVSIALFGVRVWALRLVTALFGIGVVPAVYWLARELYHDNPLRARRIGLLAAATAAVWYWLVHFSRFAIRSMMLPFLSSLLFASMLRGLRTGCRRAWAAAGFWLGVSLYTFSSARMLPLIVVACWLVVERCAPGFLRRRWREWVLVILVSAIVFAPLGLFYLRYPEWFWMRTRYLVQDSLDAQTIGEQYLGNLFRVLGAFFLRGEDFLRHNLPRRPMLDPVQATWFLVGLLTAAVGAWRGLARRAIDGVSHALLFIWVPILLLPTYLTSDAPHFSRAIGITPAVAVFVALGMERAWQWGQARGRAVWVAPLALALGLVYSGARTTYDYFVRWAGYPGLEEAFLVDLVSVGEYARALPEDETVYMTPPTARFSAILFTLGGDEHNRIKSYTGATGVAPAGREGHAATYIMRRGDEGSLATLQQRLPQGGVVARETYFVAYRVPADVPRIQPAVSSDVNWGNKVALLGYDLPPGPVQAGEDVAVTIYWRALAEMVQPYTFFLHLLGETDPKTGTTVWGQRDAQPGEGTYATPAWAPDEIVIDTYVVRVPEDAPSGTYSFAAGFYYLPTMERLPVLDQDGQVAGDHVILAEIEVVE